MLSSVLVVNASGLVLFSKSFTQTPVDRMFGALLRGVRELAKQLTQCELTYVHTTSMGIYVASASDSPVFVALFMERGDRCSAAVAKEFGRALGVRLLRAFTEEHAAELEATLGGAMSTGMFKSFAFRIPSLVRDVLRAALAQLHVIPGLEHAVLIADDGSTETFVPPGSAADLDEVTTISTVRPLMAASSDLMATLGDTLTSVNVTAGTSKRCICVRVGAGMLLLTVRSDVGEARIVDAAGLTLEVLSRLATVLARMRRFGSGGGSHSLAHTLAQSVTEFDMDGTAPPLPSVV